MLVARPLRSDRSLKLAIRSALLSLALTAATSPVALAAVPAQLDATATRSYNIAPGPLGTILSKFAVEAGIALSFQPSLTDGLTSAGLSGSYTTQEAASKLLAGSGLDMVARGDGSYTLAAQATDGSGGLVLGETTISATDGRNSALPAVYPGGQVARGGRLGLLGNTNVMDAPFSVSNYTSTLIKDQQAVTVADVLERDSSVRSTGQTGGVVDSFFIRGFPVGEGNLGELAFDGVYGVAPNYRVFTEYAERIEVIKGPGALLYGMSPNSGVGGVINVVPKRSLDEDLTRFTASYAMNAQFGGHVDLSRRFGENREFGVRINGSTQGGDTAIDEQSRDVNIGSISFDYQGERLRTSLDLISQKEEFDAPSRPFLIASGVDIPSAANGRTNVTQEWGWAETRDKSALLSGEYDVNDALTVFAHAGGGKSDVSRMSDQTPTILNSAGDTSSVPGYYKFEVERYTVDAGARLRFDTGPVSHTTSLQVTRYRDELSRAIINGAPILSNIYHPIDRPKPNIATPDPLKVSETELSGVALADTLSVLDERVQVTVGVRKQNIQSDNYNTAGYVTTSYDESETTPMFGVVVKPWDHVSLYYNYIEGLSKGDIAPATASNSGEIFAPYISRQQEVGVKVDYGTFTSTLSLFQIKKPSGELANGVFSVQGEQRNRGVELNVFGEVAEGTRLLGGVTLLDADLTDTSVAANRGNKPVGVPEVQANLWAEWDLPWYLGLTLTSGAIYTGRQYVNQANTQELDPWTRFDVGARYATRIAERPTTFRATVQNVFDREYWSGVASYGAFSQGSPRTLQLSATVDF
ncbi:TonB-dependent receptor [Pseudomonas vancouverensis]|uniref:TonB-dependent receptor n=1 Tax=Pseudomonas vancouverensis TaxID=95300 RepID=A0A1H2NJB4_PSEVA|nr:TonB-dependent receptor [Pseudomonas vancouverensis]KAB0495049.1 TonB-dependent receptor [Pseudomonas vancouverensis]TDB63911.1 TonB-dependent receptor [Pseudomonas vancouverensis]SDV05165.1 iron complex outermembrane recepter protein [Pseudomonas vancouverensis]